MDRFIIVLVTCGTEEEAIKIANALVERRLAACVNLISPSGPSTAGKGKSAMKGNGCS